MVVGGTTGSVIRAVVVVLGATLAAIDVVVPFETWLAPAEEVSLELADDKAVPPKNAATPTTRNAATTTWVLVMVTVMTPLCDRSNES